jgi:DNA polymerase III alpha subunit (gram-positive type)
MLNTNNIFVFDFETTGLSTMKDDPIQVAGVAIDPRSLEFIPGSEFNSLMRPVGVMTGDNNQIEANWRSAQQALNINGKKRAELEKAPLPEHVWKAFAAHVRKYDGGGRASKPIPAGHNIQGFDLLFYDRLNKQYKVPDFFNTRTVLDTLNLCFLWFENLPEPENFKMDTLREYLGMSKSGAHDALVDTKQTGDLLIRFLKVHRFFAPKVMFKGALAK